MNQGSKYIGKTVLTLGSVLLCHNCGQAADICAYIVMQYKLALM